MDMTTPTQTESETLIAERVARATIEAARAEAEAREQAQKAREAQERAETLISEFEELVDVMEASRKVGPTHFGQV